MIKSNPTPVRWVTHNLENNYTTEVLPLLCRFWDPPEASQPGDVAKELGIPRESDFEGLQDLIAGTPQDWGKQKLQSWRAHIKSGVHGGLGKGAIAPRRLNQTCLLTLEGPLQRHGSAVAHHGDKDPGSSYPRRHPLAWALLEVITMSPSIEPVDSKAGSVQIKQLPGRECSLTHQQTSGLLPKAINRLGAISIKLPVAFFTGLEQKNPKVCLEIQKTSNSERSLEKEKWS